MRDMEGRKDDQGKLRWELLPLDLIEKIVDVYTHGAERYGANTWQNLSNGYQRFKAALLRHLVEHEKGNKIDADSGREHLAHVAWNAIAMLYHANRESEGEPLEETLSRYRELREILEGEIEKLEKKLTNEI